MLLLRLMTCELGLHVSTCPSCSLPYLANSSVKKNQTVDDNKAPCSLAFLWVQVEGNPQPPTLQFSIKCHSCYQVQDNLPPAPFGLPVPFLALRYFYKSQFSLTLPINLQEPCLYILFSISNLVCHVFPVDILLMSKSLNLTFVLGNDR